MIDVVLFDPKHMDHIKTKEVYEKDHSIKERLKEYSKEPTVHSYTFIHDDSPVCILMVNTIFGSICDVIAVTADTLSECKIIFVKWCRSMIETYFNKPEVRRIQLVVRSDYKKGCKFVEFLGFKKEGEMHRYGADDATYSIYARVK